ncbi:MAG: metal-dependent hydrolase [Candidatus Kerfeldbacteria bacterium]|nr:metal-dependent hydrolase [Candidatus Kerfeldbacteria bacterium]
MMGKTHAVIGANTVWITTLVIAGFSWHPALPLFGALGGLLPDLDAPESMAKHLRVSVGSRRNRLSIEPLALPSLIFSTLFGHRGVLHSLFGLAVFSAIAIFGVRWLEPRVPFLPPESSILLILGYASHLVADSFTQYGIKYFWPSDRRYHLLPQFLTWSVQSAKGKFIELIISLLLSVTLIVWLLRSSQMLN